MDIIRFMPNGAAARHQGGQLGRYSARSASWLGLQTPAQRQVALKGSWSHDFAYTMLTSLGVEQCLAWEREPLLSPWCFLLEFEDDADGRLHVATALDDLDRSSALRDDQFEAIVEASATAAEA